VFLCIKPDYDVIDRGERMIRSAVQAETERCAEAAEGFCDYRDPMRCEMEEHLNECVGCRTAAAIREGKKDA